MDADSGQRVDVLPDRKAATVTSWLREHPGVRVVCRDGSGAFAQATTDADPTIVQVGDRWHLWHGLAETALKEIGAHASCWSKFGPPLPPPPGEGGSRSMTSLTRASACSHAPGVWASPSTRSSSTPATASRSVWSAPPSTGPALSIPTATTCADDETKTLPSPSPACWRRSMHASAFGPTNGISPRTREALRTEGRLHTPVDRRRSGRRSCCPHRSTTTAPEGRPAGAA
ncbi:transposase [Streptomyces mutabilis]|uniref:transposase n=1 Tax=Streptomyces mutabilis TaxID=67332 RepID=UPI003A4C50D8